MTVLVAQPNTLSLKNAPWLKRTGRCIERSAFGTLYSYRALLTGTLFTVSLLLAVLYVIEFNTVLMVGDRLSLLERSSKKAESEFVKNTALYSKIRSEIISRSVGAADTAAVLERVSKIYYVEHKQFADAAQYIH